MIENPIPADIRSFKTKVFGPLSLRQLICLIADLILFFIVYFLVIRPMGLNYQAYVVIAVLTTVVTFAFSVEIGGVPMEVYIRQVIFRAILWPVKRPANHVIAPKAASAVGSSKEEKRRRRQVKKMAKTNSKYRAYL